MNFQASFITNLPPEDRVEMKLSGLPQDIYHPADRTGSSWSIDVPENKLLKIFLSVFFRRLGEEARVSASFGGAHGISVVQTHPNFVLANINHTGSVLQAECTVECPGTGEKRSGHNVCIECRCSRGTVKICC